MARYQVTHHDDGTSTVQRQHPNLAVLRMIFLAMCIIGFFMNLSHGYWQTCGVFLILIGLLLPNYAKLRNQKKDAS